MKRLIILFIIVCVAVIGIIFHLNKEGELSDLRAEIKTLRDHHASEKHQMYLANQEELKNTTREREFE
jgi:cell division protein FtsL